MRRLHLTVTAIAAVTLTSCVVPHQHGGHGRRDESVVARRGPPPHAPAHGYRHKHHHHGVELVFDSHAGVYVVVGWDDVFFHRDHFYRVVDGVWQISVRVDQDWAPVQERKLPKAGTRRSAATERQSNGVARSRRTR
jgi:hypothetical protein